MPHKHPFVRRTLSHLRACCSNEYGQMYVRCLALPTRGYVPILLGRGVFRLQHSSLVCRSLQSTAIVRKRQRSSCCRLVNIVGEVFVVHDHHSLSFVIHALGQSPPKGHGRRYGSSAVVPFVLGSIPGSLRHCCLAGHLSPFSQQPVRSHLGSSGTLISGVQWLQVIFGISGTCAWRILFVDDLLWCRLFVIAAAFVLAIVQLVPSLLPDLPFKLTLCSAVKAACSQLHVQVIRFAAYNVLPSTVWWSSRAFKHSHRVFRHSCPTLRIIFGHVSYFLLKEPAHTTDV